MKAAMASIGLQYSMTQCEKLSAGQPETSPLAVVLKAQPESYRGENI